MRLIDTEAKEWQFKVDAGHNMKVDVEWRYISPHSYSQH
jgi:hypothetical protein